MICSMGNSGLEKRSKVRSSSHIIVISVCCRFFSFLFVLCLFVYLTVCVCGMSMAAFPYVCLFVTLLNMFVSMFVYTCRCHCLCFRSCGGRSHNVWLICISTPTSKKKPWNNRARINIFLVSSAYPVTIPYVGH